MKAILKFEFKRLFKSKFLYLSLAIGAILCIWDTILQCIEVNRTNSLINEFGSIGLGLIYPRTVFNSFISLDYYYLPAYILYIIFPLLVTLPYALSYHNDRSSGYIKNILIKIEREKYYLSKYIAVFCSGFFTALTILLFGLLLTSLFFPYLPPVTITNTFSPLRGSEMFFELFYTHPLVYTLIYILIDSIFMGIFACLALLISIFAQNTLIIFAGSMIIYVAAEYILELFQLTEFSPMAFLVPTQIGCSAKIYIILTEAIIMTLLSVVPFFAKEKNKDVF